MWRRAVTVALCLTGGPLQAQLADTLQHFELKETAPKASRNALNDIYNQGQQLQVFDSAKLIQYEAQQISQLLLQQSAAAMRSYGVNVLASLSIRGASAAQTAVLWNGIPIQNAALGIADIATLPVIAADNIALAYGSSSALWGSGNVGGALILQDNLPQYDSNLHFTNRLSLSGGSFSTFQGAYKGSIRSKNWLLGLKASGYATDNNIRYTDYQGREQRLTNAEGSGGAVILNAAHRISLNDEITGAVWLQRYNRYIPPALFENRSQKRQEDNALRTMLAWNHREHNGHLYARGALLTDNLDYSDSAIGLSSLLKTNTIYAEAGRELFISRHRLLVFAPLQYAVLKGTSGKEQVRAGLAAAHAYHTKDRRLKTSVQLRTEYVIDKWVVLPGAGLSYGVFKNISLTANAQRSYRAPTLNELYYWPGGNESLQPERGWSLEGGLRKDWQGRVNEPIASLSVTGYRRYIKDWIIWYGGSVWTPHNIAAVRSAGIEAIGQATFSVRRIKIDIESNYSFTSSVTKASIVPGDKSIGAQVPYVPRHSGYGSVTLRYRRALLAYSQIFNSYRFTTADESQWVDGYTTGNLYLSVGKMLNNKQITAFVQLQNIWNAAYQTVAARPMPGRALQAGISLATGMKD